MILNAPLSPSLKYNHLPFDTLFQPFGIIPLSQLSHRFCLVSVRIRESLNCRLGTRKTIDIFNRPVHTTLKKFENCVWSHSENTANVFCPNSTVFSFISKTCNINIFKLILFPFQERVLSVPMCYSSHFWTLVIHSNGSQHVFSEIELQLVVLRIKSKILAIRIWLIGTGGVHIKLEDAWLRQPIFVLLRKRSREVWGPFPVKPKQNLEPYDWRAVLFAFFLIWREVHFIQEVSGVYSSPFFYTQINEKWLYGPEKFPGLSRNGPLESKALRVLLSAEGTFLAHPIEEVPDLGRDDHILKLAKGTFHPQCILHLPVLTSIVTSCYIAVRKLQKMKNHWLNFAKRRKHSNKFCTRIVSNM